MMLNLQFAETMELTAAELEQVYGGNFTMACVGENIGCGGSALPVWGGRGISPRPYGAFDWSSGLIEGLFGKRRN